MASNASQPTHTATVEATLDYAFNYQRDIQKLANGGVFYLQSNSATETRMGEQIVDSLNNIANAAVQNNDTIGKLVIANNNLTDSIVSLQAHNLKQQT